jgi:hypothetical protein
MERERVLGFQRDAIRRYGAERAEHQTGGVPSGSSLWDRIQNGAGV